jgi:fumarate hydratase class II
MQLEIIQAFGFVKKACAISNVSNVNEVISNRGIEIIGGIIGSEIHVQLIMLIKTNVQIMHFQ